MAITDKITDVRNAARPVTASASSPRSAGGTSLACDSLTGWPVSPRKVHFVTYTVDSNNNPIVGSQLDCVGIVSGNTIGSFAVIDGTDAGNSIGDKVEMLPTAAWAQDLADALTEEHDREGHHVGVTNTGGMSTDTLTVSSGTSLPAGDIITADIADDAVTAAKVSGLDYSNITDLSNPYKFGVYHAAAFNWTSSETILKFDTEEFDTNSNYTSVTGLYTAPVAGFYIFSWNVFAATAGTTYYANLYKNGAAIKRGVDIGVSSSPFLSRGSGGGTSLVQAAANDTFGVFIFSDGTHAGFPGQQFCYFNGILMCRT